MKFRITRWFIQSFQSSLRNSISYPINEQRSSSNYILRDSFKGTVTNLKFIWRRKTSLNQRVLDAISNPIANFFQLISTILFADISKPESLTSSLWQSALPVADDRLFILVNLAIRKQCKMVSVAICSISLIFVAPGNRKLCRTHYGERIYIFSQNYHASRSSFLVNFLFFYTNYLSRFWRVKKIKVGFLRFRIPS